MVLLGGFYFYLRKGLKEIIQAGFNLSGIFHQ